MGAPSDHRTLVLHGLRLRGSAEPPAVAEVTGLDAARAAAELDALRDAGLVTYREGRLAGFMLTPDGRVEHAARLAAELDVTGVRDEVHARYQLFLEVNPRLLEVCTRWQLREVDGQQVHNDHTDPDHDAAVIDQLAEVHHDVTPVLTDLAELLARFGRYHPRLRSALEGVRGGDLDLFTKPIVPSYHTVWFELHEDLLATLAIERSSEVSA
jgi:hypothetical protein